MVEESYVDFLTAKLLKEKGFDGECSMYYDTEEIKEIEEDEDSKTPEPEKVGRESLMYDYAGIYIKAPTLQMAMKWLREVHKLDIDIDVYSKHSWCDSTDYCISIFSHGYRIMIEKNEVFDTYEEAEKAAILYALKNII